MLQTEKTAFRKEAEARRARLEEPERVQRGAAVRERLRSFAPLRGARLVALYANKGAEVPTEGIFLDLLARGKSAAAPVISGTDLHLRRLVAWELLVVGPFGVSEPPASAATVAPDEVDLWLVPGVAFDRAGHRLGRGGGHYDRLLAAARSGAPRVGLCFEAQIVEAVPAEPHDVSMDFLVTESRVLGPLLPQRDDDRSEP